MRVLALWLVLLAPAASAASRTGFDVEESRRRCAVHGGRALELYYTDFHWYMTREQMRRKFDEIYDSGKRLPLHARYDSVSGGFLVPLERRFERGLVPITVDFIRNVVQHVEASLDAGYAEFVFPADMGHAHLYLARERWDRAYAAYRGSLTGLYALMLADPSLRPLYHTAEQLLMVDPETREPLDDPDIARRYWNRNVLGSNDGSGRIEVAVRELPGYNTVDSLAGHRVYSAGFLISASRLGCFGYLDRHGAKRYFDIGLTDLGRDPRLEPLIEP